MRWSCLNPTEHAASQAPGTGLMGHDCHFTCYCPSGANFAPGLDQAPLPPTHQQHGLWGILPQLLSLEGCRRPAPGLTICSGDGVTWGLMWLASAWGSRSHELKISQTRQECTQSALGRQEHGSDISTKAAGNETAHRVGTAWSAFGKWHPENFKKLP